MVFFWSLHFSTVEHLPSKQTVTGLGSVSDDFLDGFVRNAHIGAEFLYGEDLMFLFVERGFYFQDQIAAVAFTFSGDALDVFGVNADYFGRGFYFKFFCLDAKERKNQDLDLFAKKLKFLPIKSPKLTPDGRRTASGFGRIVDYFDEVKLLPPLKQWGFLCLFSRKSSHEEILIFINAKISYVLY